MRHKLVEILCGRRVDLKLHILKGFLRASSKDDLPRARTGRNDWLRYILDEFLRATRDDLPRASTRREYWLWFIMDEFL